MILLTHAVVGAAVARLFPTHPWIGFFAAVASHFAADAIPHWQYTVGSMVRNKKSVDNRIVLGGQLAADMFVVSLDFACGLALSLYFFGHGFSLASQPLIVMGAIGGALPDGLQFIYFFFRHEPLLSLQRFHAWIHARRHIDSSSRPGMAAQGLFLAGIVILSRLIMPL